MPLVETPLNVTMICFVPDGIPVKSMLVPDVVATGVPRVNPAARAAAEVQVVPLEVNTLPEVLGATNKGELVPLPRMTLLAVRVARLVPPFAIGNVPVTPVDKGRPVALVKVPLAGVPKTGAVNTGAVSVLFVSVFVLVAVTTLLGVMIPDSAIVAMIDPLCIS
jgi:hypothetical protein